MNAGGGCTRLASRLHAVLTSQNGSATALRKLSCVDCGATRPSYQGLFVFASELPRLHGRLVLLANADVLFDATLAQLPPTPRGHVHTLTVNANGECRWRRQLPWWLPVAVRGGAVPMRADGRAPHTLSWDAYAFRSPLPAGLGATATAAAFGVTRDGPLYMNAFRAENRAACALAVAGAQLHSACLLVRLRHLHGARKMHGAAASLNTDACDGAAEGRARARGAPAPAVPPPPAAPAHGEGWPCEFHDAAPLRLRDGAYTFVVDARICTPSYADVFAGAALEGGGALALTLLLLVGVVWWLLCLQ